MRKYNVDTVEFVKYDDDDCNDDVVIMRQWLLHAVAERCMRHRSDRLM